MTVQWSKFKIIQFGRRFMLRIQYTSEFVDRLGDLAAAPHHRLTLAEIERWAIAAHEVKGQGYGMTSVDDGGMDGWHPYSYHLKGVVLVLRLFGVKDECTLAGGYLHDVFEDTDFTVQDAYRAGIPVRAIAFAWACTDGEAPTRKERKAEAYRKIRRIRKSLLVKLADRIHNSQHAADSGGADKWRLYVEEMESFRGSLRRRTHLPRTRRMWAYLEWVLSEPGLEALAGQSPCCYNATEAPSS